MPTFYPLHLNIAGRRCVVIGGGKVAERKVLSLLPCGAAVVVVSPSLTPRLKDLAAGNKIEHLACVYDPLILREFQDVLLVFSATNDQQVNRQVARDCAERGILVNVADAPDTSDFIVPATLRRGELCLSVSTGGKSPFLARKIREELEEMYGPEYTDLVRVLAELRQEVKIGRSNPEQRREVYVSLVEEWMQKWRSLS